MIEIKVEKIFFGTKKNAEIEDDFGVFVLNPRETKVSALRIVASYAPYANQPSYAQPHARHE